jgi:hypothetical protein
VQVVNEYGFTLTSEEIQIILASEPEVTVTVTDPTCLNASNGEIELEISETPFPYSITWDGNTTGLVIQNLSAGVYNYTIEYLNSCSVNGSVVVENGDEIIAETYVMQTPCFQGSEGLVQFINMTGTGITELLINGSTVQNPVSGLSAGTHAYEITDEVGCSTEGELVLEEYPELITILTFENVSCFAADDGLIDIWNQSETGFGSCEINGLESTIPATNLSPGFYEITYTDANGCDAEMTAEIAEPAMLDLQLSTIDANDLILGSAYLNIAGGTEPYTIFWTSGDDDLEAENLDPGVYQVTVTDNNGCSETIQFEIDFIENINEFSTKNQDITIYPNPGDGIMVIDFDKLTTKTLYYRVINTFGEIVVSGQINNDATKSYIDIHHLSDGIYFIYLNDFYTVIKYIKQG